MIDETGRLAHIDDATQHITSIFPDDTDLTCTLIAGTNANTWSLWIEIIDSGATTLSSLFADESGHLTSILIETVSDDSAIYMYEISWGADRNVITRGRFAGVGKFQQAHIQDRFWPPPSPAGETIYYRMKTETAIPDDCTVHFRYHLH